MDTDQQVAALQYPVANHSLAGRAVETLELVGHGVSSVSQYKSAIKALALVSITSNRLTSWSKANMSSFAKVNDGSPIIRYGACSSGTIACSQVSLISCISARVMAGAAGW